jgi:quercetin dioxygenase-like cupin family protein
LKSAKLEDMIKGWFVGSFEPSVLRTEEFEVAVKSYLKGDSEEKHFHKIATEVTVVVSGRVQMANQEWGPGSIITLEPGESTSFLAIEDSTTVVVKTPSTIGDKYLEA